MRPVAPSEIGEAKGAFFPPEVIQAFNECITAHFSHSSANFTQEKVVDRITELMQVKNESFHRSMIFTRGYLNVEAYYEGVGWKVEYDRPGYCETYDANYTFTKR